MRRRRLWADADTAVLCTDAREGGAPLRLRPDGRLACSLGRVVAAASAASGKECYQRLRSAGAHAADAASPAPESAGRTAPLGTPSASTSFARAMRAWNATPR